MGLASLGVMLFGPVLGPEEPIARTRITMTPPTRTRTIPVFAERIGLAGPNGTAVDPPLSFDRHSTFGPPV